METNIKKLNIAVVGCLHGHLKDLYTDLENYEKKNQMKIDFVLCCGDFQCIRTKSDLNYLACPVKYRQIGQFSMYYNTKTVAPYLTIFIGGNHEASNVLEENFYGGWIAQNVYYLGRAGVINVKGVRIAGLSGIFKYFDYFRGHYEIDLLKNIKSVYHTREYEVAKLSNLTGNIDIFMSHDWPNGVVNPKDYKRIFKIKPHWKEEIETNTLGSPATSYLLKLLKPKYWIAAHMHYTYSTDIQQDDNVNSQSTKFIALDKPQTNRTYFYVFQYETQTDSAEDSNVYLDGEWIAITKAFNDYIPFESTVYNFSKFFPNSTAYINQIAGIYMSTFKNGKCYVDPAINFTEILNQARSEFAGAKTLVEWKNMKESEKRAEMVALFGIEDYHLQKNKIPLVNKEEINVDVDFV